MAAPMQRLSRIGCPVLPVRGASKRPGPAIGADTRGRRATVRAQQQGPEGWASRGGRSAAAAGLVLLSLVDLTPSILPARADAAASPLLEEVARATEGDVSAGVEARVAVEGVAEAGDAEAGDTEDGDTRAGSVVVGDIEVGEQAGPAPALEAADAGQEQALGAPGVTTSEPGPDAQGPLGLPWALEEVQSPAVEAPEPGVSLEPALQVIPTVPAGESGTDAEPGPEPEGAQEDTVPAVPAAFEESDGAEGRATALGAGDSVPALPLQEDEEALSPDASAQASGPGAGSGQALVAVAVSALGAAVLAISRVLGLSARQEELKDELSKAERQVKEGRRLLVDMQALIAAQAKEAETVVAALRTSGSTRAEALERQLQETQASLKRVEEELSSSSEEGGRMRARLEEQDASIVQLKRQLEERSLTIASLGAEMQEQQLELDKAEQARAQAEQEAEARAQSLAKAEQGQASLEKKLRELAQAGPRQVADLEKKAAALQAQLQAAAEEKQATEERLVELEQASRAEREATAVLEEQMAAQAQQLATAEERVQSLLARVRRMEGELAAKEEERASLALRLQEKDSQSAI